MRWDAIRPILYGCMAAVLMLGTYVIVVGLISGFYRAQEQFADYWYFITGLAIGFGIQVGLYAHLRERIRDIRPGAVVGVSGATSTMAMISCCAHYLVNLIPLIGASAILTLVAEYQIELFWLGVGMNLLGIAYMLRVINRIENEK